MTSVNPRPSCPSARPSASASACNEASSGGASLPAPPADRARGRKGWTERPPRAVAHPRRSGEHVRQRMSRIGRQQEDALSGRIASEAKRDGRCNGRLANPSFAAAEQQPGATQGADRKRARRRARGVAAARHDEADLKARRRSSRMQGAIRRKPAARAAPSIPLRAGRTGGRWAFRRSRAMTFLPLRGGDRRPGTAAREVSRD